MACLSTELVLDYSVARYRLESRLGAGAMGTVYVAYDPELDRRVALKLVHPELVRSDAVLRLLREGRALARLTHPNIVTVYDAGTDGDRVYIAMELVDGDTLTAWLETTQRDWRAIVSMFVAIGKGLAAAHAAGVVHRDVKPDNVLVTRDGQPKVVDFGLASRARSRGPAALVDPASRITHEGEVLGTPAFMSPEQWNGADVGPASDQYSLCSALQSALATRPRPAWVDRAIARGTAEDPAARFASMTALVDALDPDRRARRWRYVAIATATPVLLASIASVALLRTPASHPLEASCRAASNDRAALWTPSEQQRVQMAIYATGVPWAHQVWERANRNMNGYLRVVAKAETATCAAAPRTADALDGSQLSLACLADSRNAVRGLVARLQSPTVHDVRGGLRGWFALPEPTHCTNIALLRTQRDIEKGAPSQAGDRMERAIAEAKSADERGDTDEAIALAHQAVDVAATLGDPYLARAYLELGDRYMVADAAAAERAYRDALAATERVSLDDMRVDAMLQLMKALARQDGRERDIIDLAPLVTAAAQRAGHAGRAAPHVHRLLGVAHDKLGDSDEAVRHLEAALALARTRHKNPMDRRLIKYLMTLGEVLDRAGRRREADAHFEEAVRLSTAVNGEDDEETRRLIAASSGRH